MANEFESAEYKRGFIMGMLMNPLFVTTETAPVSSAETSGIILASESGFRVGVINNVIKVIDVT